MQIDPKTMQAPALGEVRPLQAKCQRCGKIDKINAQGECLGCQLFDDWHDDPEQGDKPELSAPKPAQP